MEREIVYKSLLLSTLVNLRYHFPSSSARFSFTELLTFLLLSATDTGCVKVKTFELQRYRISMHHPNYVYYIRGGVKIF